MYSIWIFPMFPDDNKSAVVQVMIWSRTGNKPLSWPIRDVQVYWHIHASLNLSAPIEAEQLIYASVYKAIVGSDNGLSPLRHQAIIWNSDYLLWIRSLGTNFSEILSKYKHFHSRICIWNCRLRKGGHFVSASINLWDMWWSIATFFWCKCVYSLCKNRIAMFLNDAIYLCNHCLSMQF